MRVLSFQIFFTIFFLGAMLGRSSFEKDELLDFEASLQTVQAFVNADAERLLKQQKVISIINDFRYVLTNNRTSNFMKY